MLVTIDILSYDSISNYSAHNKVCLSVHESCGNGPDTDNQTSESDLRIPLEFKLYSHLAR